MNRTATLERNTNETKIEIELNIDGEGNYDIDTGIGFFDHMLEGLCKHGLFDLNVKARGDLHVDQHHLVEDVGIALGQAFGKALGDKKGIERSGYFVYPMDEALAVVAVDLGGRAYLQYDCQFTRRFCGELDLDLIPDFFAGLAQNIPANLAVRMPYGRSDHHKLEACFKALAKALRGACAHLPRALDKIPSTKGSL